MSTSGSSEENTLRFLRDVRNSFDEDSGDLATAEDTLDQLVSIRSFAFKFIKDAATQPPDGHHSTQEGLNLLWHMFCITAQALDSDDPFQDKLVSLLQWTIEYDALYKSVHHIENTTPWEKYGFAESLQNAWESLVRDENVSQMRNLARFSAKVLALGICRGVDSTALWFLREALETQRDPSTLAMLPAVAVWLDESNYCLMALSLGRHPHHPETSKAHLQGPGPLAVAAGVLEPGFSVQRWLFWRTQLQELSKHADLVVAKAAKKGFMDMISCGRIMEMDVPGEARFAGKLQKAMWEELVRSGKKSVDGDDIDIDVNWVN
ncbi:hypothetical protein CkaCkLH20_08532 [Colletotrichum karsti]|uniref:Uncharacterized protein n=1 Tax=Colletotrichum karsti TaxID=1095194 RepID=A0A9P6HZL2_9PEZI|nr:uncharacterized protein CkaCkLH20_08532 [Colletotrichum karsti]KAF9873798.1 hypothetical protein CkaCkLH20_08532 [Colletotrichum karsti]